MARRRRKPVEETPKETKEYVSDEDRIIAKYKEKVSNPLTAIRAMCIECMGGGVHEVAECVSVACALHPFRMGKNVMHGRYGKPNAKTKTDTS